MSDVLTFPTRDTDVTPEHLRRVRGEQAPIAAPRPSALGRRLAAYADEFGTGPAGSTLTLTAPDGTTVTVELSAGAEQQLSTLVRQALDSVMEERAEAAMASPLAPTAVSVRALDAYTAARDAANVRPLRPANRRALHLVGGDV